MSSELHLWLEAFLGCIPGRIGARLRRLWYATRLRRVGPNALWGRHTEVLAPDHVSIGSNFSLMSRSVLVAEGGELTIGDRVSINSNVVINAADGGRIEIGNDVLIGPNVVLRASDHAFGCEGEPINRQGHTPGSIVIEDDVWIGSTAVIVGGVRVSAHSVVAAGAVVAKDVEPWCVVGGVPARVLKKRK